LVLEERGDIYLVVDPSRKTKLILDGDAKAIRSLLGCKITVEGRQGLGSVRVETYEVVDAGFGNRPHVGVLVRHGPAWRIHDVNSGALLELVGERVDDFNGYEGATILVNGVIVGPHMVQVMNYRILLPE
jgi:hypothetical protein